MMMKSILVGSYLILMGLLLSSGAGCSPGVTSEVKTSPTAPFRETLTPSITSNISTAVDSENDPTPTMNGVNMDQATLETASPPTEALTITIIYDNNEFDQRLKTAWGFSALVEHHGHILLFDTGGDGLTLLENMRILGIEPTQIESVMLSHGHGDHTGGLEELLTYGARPTVYMPPSFSSVFKKQVSEKTEVIEVTPGFTIAAGLFTTGEMGRSIPEQALIIQTEPGLVIVTGCAHPGIVEIVEQAQTLLKGQVRLVLGGFHLEGKREVEIDAILTAFRRLEVEQVAPSHCTGDPAIAMFAAEYGEDFIQAGVGRRIIIR
jgi:7,8-dihydropterin-6-yl-methyl-4-(beta-D-ribofuranosyl)aminobenzene 5'-phosphate synthase